MDLNEIYKKEKIINSHFRKKYDYNNEEIFNKQVLELLCELSEFAYETKCFKYWKNEKQSSPDITIPEFADCLISEVDEKNMVNLFIETYKIASTLSFDLDREKLLKILSNLLAISKLLGYTDEQLYDYCISKMDKTLNMISN